MERQVLLILVQGYSLAEAAEKLGRAPSTISTHVNRVRRKLKTRSPMHTVLVFARQFWLEELAEGT